MRLKAGEFYGETAKTMTAGDFSFTEKCYSLDASLPSHAHELPHFCLVLNGNYSEKIGSKSFERTSGALVYYPPDLAHKENHYSPGRHFLVEIDWGGLNRVRDYGAGLDEPVFLAGDDSLHLALKMYREFINRDAFSPLALESLSTELLIHAGREGLEFEQRKPPKWLNEVKELLATSYTDPPGLKDLSKFAGIHPTHLARVFRRFEKCSAGEYVRRIRIEKAREKMLMTRKTLVEIALETGFSDQAHFNRSFKRATGMTPSKFRKLFQSS